MTAPTVTQLAGSVAFLRSWLARIAEDPTFPIEELAREIRDERSRLARYDHERPDRKPGIPVRCLADHPDGDGRACDWRLHTDGTHIVVCPQCGTQWTPEALLDGHAFALLPAAVLVLLSDDPAKARRQIHNATARNQLTVHDYAVNPTGGPPRPLYRLGEYRAMITRR